MTSNLNCAFPVTVSNSVTMSVTPFSFPDVSIVANPNDTVCKGTPVTMNAITLFGGTAPIYDWRRNGAPVGINSPSFTFAPNDGDVISCILNSSYPCRLANADTSSPITLTVIDPEVLIVNINATPGTTIGHGQKDTLTAVAINAISPTYQWFINGIPVTGATNATFIDSNFSYPNSDSVSCMVTSNGVCHTVAHQWLYITVTTVGVNQLATGSDINVVPNPNKGEFTVKGSLGAIDEEVSLEMTNMLGQVVYKNKVTARNGKLNEHVRLGSNVANGMYMLSLHSGTENKVFHIVIEQ